VPAHVLAVFGPNRREHLAQWPGLAWRELVYRVDGLTAAERYVLVFLSDRQGTWSRPQLAEACGASRATVDVVLALATDRGRKGRNGKPARAPLGLLAVGVAADGRNTIRTVFPRVLPALRPDPRAGHAMGRVQDTRGSRAGHAHMTYEDLQDDRQATAAPPPSASARARPDASLIETRATQAPARYAGAWENLLRDLQGAASRSCPQYRDARTSVLAAVETVLHRWVDIYDEGEHVFAHIVDAVDAATSSLLDGASRSPSHAGSVVSMYLARQHDNQAAVWVTVHHEAQDALRELFGWRGTGGTAADDNPRRTGT
jgi:hypothetical protein